MRRVISLPGEGKADTFVKMADITRYCVDPKEGDRKLRLKIEPYSPCCKTIETQQDLPS